MRGTGRGRAQLLVTASVLLLAAAASAGGPIGVGGPGVGQDGKPFIWDPAAMPVKYRVDGGPLSKAGSTVIVNNADGVARVLAMFQVWQDVPTAAITYQNLGAVQPVSGFSDGDVSTATEYDAMEQACFNGTQTAIAFDADGTIFNQLFGDPSVIGFAGICSLNVSTGFARAALGVLNGRFIDGINNPSANPANLELSGAEFDQAFVHEFGHLSGLDHTQINLEALFQPSCTADQNAGLPIMFPILACEARVTAGLAPLAADDVSWISVLYPETVNDAPNGKVPFNQVYGFVRGRIFFSDGVFAVQGVNVIARLVDDPGTPEDESLRVAVSAVSGVRFTANPGQPVLAGYLGGTDDNSDGFPDGSRDVALLGLYEIALPPATYTIEVESIELAFAGGSGLNPLNPPVPSPGADEFWNVGESATDDPAASDTVTVTAGAAINDKDIVLNGTPDTFDAFESARLWWPDPLSDAAEVSA